MLSASDNESMRSSSILPAKLVVRNSTGPQAKEHRDLQKNCRRVAPYCSAFGQLN